MANTLRGQAEHIRRASSDGELQTPRSGRAQVGAIILIGQQGWRVRDLGVEIDQTNNNTFVVEPPEANNLARALDNVRDVEGG